MHFHRLTFDCFTEVLLIKLILKNVSFFYMYIHSYVMFVCACHLCEF